MLENYPNHSTLMTIDSNESSQSTYPSMCSVYIDFLNLTSIKPELVEPYPEIDRQPEPEIDADSRHIPVHSERQQLSGFEPGEFGMELDREADNHDLDDSSMENHDNVLGYSHFTHPYQRDLQDSEDTSSCPVGVEVTKPNHPSYSEALRSTDNTNKDANKLLLSVEVKLNRLKPAIYNDSDDDAYYCDQCEFSSFFKRGLAGHKTRIHALISAVEVAENVHDETPVGENIQHHQRNLLRHRRRKHDEISNPGDQCENVNTISSSLNVYDERGKVKMCDLCDYSTFSRAGILRHKYLKHPGKEHKCDQCAYVTYKKMWLVAHRTKLHSASTFYCEECTFSTSIKRRLIRHTK